MLPAAADMPGMSMPGIASAGGLAGAACGATGVADVVAMPGMSGGICCASAGVAAARAAPAASRIAIMAMP